MIDTVLTHIVQIFQASHDVLYGFAFVVACFLLASGLDDIASDLYYWFHQLFYHRKLNPYDKLPKEELYKQEEKPIAIFVPAWHEAEVIDKMLTRACRTLRYKNYDIFVGVYPNDPETEAKVQQVAEIFPQVHTVMGTHHGPSTKAQNLNEIHRAMLKWENLTGIRYDIVILHDAEDVIHPLSLKIFNYFVPRYDMVQLPVFPLPTPHRDIIHWTYCDEFSENHTKDLMARHLFSGFTPSAGVGTAYNRWLMDFVGTSFARNLFTKRSLTEDYDMALRLALGEARLLYLYRPFGINAATRAYFPHRFRTAVRQKTRWLIGICLQSWRNYGWVGNTRFRVTLYRDRKAVLTNLINILAYIVLIYVLLYELAERGLADYGKLTPIIVEGTPLWYIVVVDTGLMLWRFFHRFLTVSRVYGYVAGLLSVLRYPIGNIVNFTASTRAIRQYLWARSNNEHIAWDKTTHKYPTFKEST